MKMTNKEIKQELKYLARERSNIIRETAVKCSSISSKRIGLKEILFRRRVRALKRFISKYRYVIMLVILTALLLSVAFPTIWKILTETIYCVAVAQQIAAVGIIAANVCFWKGRIAAMK